MSFRRVYCMRERRVQSNMEKQHESRAAKEQGFTLLGVLIAVLIMGTMATVAVPKFTAAIAAGNTTKIQADMAAIDTAIALYSIDQGTVPTTMSQLDNYLEHRENIKPPTGNCNINGTVQPVPAEEYNILDDKTGSGMQAHLGKYTIYDFGSKSDAKPKKE